MNLPFFNDRNNNRLTRTVGENIIQTGTYGASGNPLTFSADSEVVGASGVQVGDGVVDRITTYTHNSNGSLVNSRDVEFGITTIYTNLDYKIISLIDLSESAVRQ